MANKLKDRLLARTANLAEKVEAASIDRPSIADQRPVTMPGQLGAFRLEAQRYQRQIDELTSELEKARKTGAALDIPLDLLDEVPGRRRHLTDEQKLELRENLRHNTLTHPITVRARPNGRFEIISGHNRTDQYRDLGRETIRAVLLDVSDDDAAASAFYANLLQSDLTDYEKYLGFKDIQARRPELTQATIAEISGVTEAVLSKLFSFGRLPDDVLVLLDARFNLLGANSAQALAGLTKEGKAKAVVEAVTQLAQGVLKYEEQAVNRAKAQDKPKAAAPASVKIKVGRSVYCDVRLVSKSLRIDFQSEEEAARLNTAIQALLEVEAKASKDTKADSEK